MTSCFRLRESAAYVDAKTSNTTEPKDGNADNGVRCAVVFWSFAIRYRRVFMPPLQRLGFYTVRVA